MTSRQVAEALGVPLSTYKNWEAGNCKPSELYIEKIVGIFGSFPTQSA
jgi:transcriptional regulator with XRE-family HTH domain